LKLAVDANVRALKVQIDANIQESTHKVDQDASTGLLEDSDGLSNGGQVDDDSSVEPDVDP
jgi:hypothetical protein